VNRAESTWHVFPIARHQLIAALWVAFASFGALSAGASIAVAGVSARFAEAIEGAEAQVVDLTAESDLLGSKDFLTIYNNPESFYSDAIEFISDRHRTDQQATIAILSMQRLPLYRYIDFCEEVFTLRQVGAVSQDVFETTLLPGYDWNTKFAENYADVKVRTLLDRIRSSGLLHGKSGDANSVEYIDSILSGEADRHVKEFRAAGQIP
jgi:hypothetical protein